jgi:hypothetical protein
LFLGSSWGGNICLRLINQGHWKGPTVLLAPAHKVVAEKCEREAPTIPKCFQSPIHIYHSRGINNNGPGKNQELGIRNQESRR